MHKNRFLDVLKVKESKSAIKILEKQHFHGENRGWKFCNKNFLVPNFDLKLRAVDITLQTKFFPILFARIFYWYRFVWELCFSRFLKKLRLKFYTFYTENIFAKNLHFNYIANVPHIETIEHILTIEEDKQLHTQIPQCCVTKNAVACTTEVFMIGVPMFFLYHFDHIQFLKWITYKQFQLISFKITFMSFSLMMYFFPWLIAGRGVSFAQALL